ncbi:DUF6382 domain-containing protein [Paenibacillus bovis]|uniref:FHA domain-containing protein n=1 Tax=Paenibacillus bovis TaxID=1616788 RepID=A0A172ZEG2_9BACL|nr:DUF6382 domain-containing protein [Paenibacillus bovis]ANF96044.1 hypothetical protein AR543_08580 [Paenibacillus bovis]
METLTQDFIQDGKTYMTVDREQGFQQSDLSKTQTGMMLSSRIRGILQLHLHEVNMKAVLRYDISGKKMLRHCLQSEPMGIAEYLGLLLQIVSTLEESSQYMLSLPNYVLDEQYMFVDGTLQAGGLYLTYVPSLEMLTDEPVQSILSRLASRWMAYVSELTGNKVQRILKYCQNDNFTLQELKLLLLELLADYQQHPVTESYTGYNSGHAGYSAPNSAYRSDSTAQPERISAAGSHAPTEHAAREAAHYSQTNNPRHNPDAANSGAANPVLQHLRNQRNTSASAAERPDKRIINPAFAASMPAAGSNGKQQGISADPSTLFAAAGNRSRLQTASALSETAPDDAEESNAKPLSSAHRTYLLAGGALLIAMIWRFGYLEHGNDMMLYGCTAITIAVGILIYMIIKGKLSGANKLKLPVLHKSKQEDEEYGSESWRWNSEPATADGLAMAAAAGIGYGAHSNPVSQRDQSIAAIFGGESSRQTGQYQDRASTSSHEVRTDNGSRITEQQYYSSSQVSQGSPHQTVSGFGESIPDTGLLSSHMATVLLDESSAMSSHGASKMFQGYLERRELDGMQTEPIRLTPGTFVIGRAEEGVDYYEKSVGTSRNHVELEISDQQILIKDLSSRNGTLLGSEPLVPYKTYPMQNGDSFTIARAVFTLRLA